MDESIQRIKELNEEKSKKLLEKAKHEDLVLANIQTQQVIVQVANSLVEYLDNKENKTEVTNQLTEIGTPDALVVARAVDSLHHTMQGLENTDLTGVTEVMQSILDEAKKIPKELPKEKEQKFVDYTPQLKSLGEAVKAVEKVVKAQKLIAEAPVINLPETNVNVDAPDLKPLQKGLKDVVSAVNKVVIPETDTKEMEKLLKASNKLLKDLLKKPVSSGGGGGGSAWPALGTNGFPAPLNLDSSGNLKTTATISGGGDATAANQVLQTALLTTIDTDTGNIATEVAGLLTDTELRATPVPVSGTVTATPTGTQNVDVTANTIGLATAANQLPDGHNVTVDNGAGVNAVNIQDGGNSITVDGTVTAAAQPGVDIGDVTINNTTATPVPVQPPLSGYLNVSIDQTGNNNAVDVLTMPTVTETNSAAIKTAVETIDNAIAGNEMQVDVVAPLPAGTNNIGDVDVLSLPALPAGTNNIGDVDVLSAVSATMDHGSNRDIDTTAEQITSTSFAAKFGVTVKAAVDNTDTVYIGNSDVTAGTTAATDGFPLEPGESITLPVNNSNLLYAIGAAANQKVFWSAV